MIRNIISATFALLVIVQLSPAVTLRAVGQETTFPSPQIIDPEFLLEKGATVDFIFGEERPFRSCHASTVVETANGDILCAFFAGSGEKNPDVGIWMSRYSGGNWGPVTLGVKVNETAHWNPVLFRDARSGIHLFFKVGPEIPYWQTYWITSTDDGRTWSEATELVAGDKGGRGPVKNKPILLPDGTWLAGASTELGGWDPFFDRSTDLGKTWTRTEDIAIGRDVLKGRGAIQPTMWEWKPGHVRAVFRTTSGFLARSDSADGGLTWSPLGQSGLPNNSSGVDAVRVDDGRVFLVYNPTGRRGGRSPLNIAVSHDDGDTWKDFASLEFEPRREFSYPAIVKTKDGISVSYTWKRQRVRAWQIPFTALEGI
ncbi:MAG: sialidase family protein [Candidatus Hydrogenedentota bacterium]